MSTDNGRDLFTRIRELIESFRGDDDEGGSAVESAARALEGMVSRLGDNATVRRLISGEQSDVLTGPRERVDLTAQLGIVARLASRVRFSLGEQVVEVPVVEGNSVQATFTAPAPGLHRVTVEVCDAQGIAVPGGTGEHWLQVADGRPVALVHVESILTMQDGERASALRRALDQLIAGGMALAYFDIHEKNRTAAIRDALREQRLPDAAVLVHAAAEENLRALGLDFVRMFGVTAVRRLRARGVPVTTIITDAEQSESLAASEHIQVLRPEQVVAMTRVEGSKGAKQPGPFEPQVTQARALLAERRAADPRSWRLGQATRSALVAGNHFTAEFDNARARKALFAAIDGARRSIHLQFYLVRDSAFTESLIVKLIQRAREGVRVRLMVDALYSGDKILGYDNPLLQSLDAEPNIDVMALSPIESARSVGLGTLKKRDHRKVAIVDGRHAFVLGRNAADEYFSGFAEVPIHDNTRHERIPWLDAHVEIRGPLVGHVQQMFIDTWHGQDGPRFDAREELPENEPAGPAAGRLIIHRGFEDANGLAMYEEMLDLATDHVFIVNDFPIVNALEQAIGRLLARGVRVVLLTGSASARRDDGSFFPGPLFRAAFEYMVKAKLERLLRAGVEVYEFVAPPSPAIVARGGRVRPYVHAKVVSVDGQMTSIGSANLDVTASFWESEANIVVEDAAFAAGVEQQLSEMIAGSLKLDPESDYWKQERAQRAVVDTIWPETLYS